MGGEQICGVKSSRKRSSVQAIVNVQEKEDMSWTMVVCGISTEIAPCIPRAIFSTNI